ncbi:DUF3822 family protein [Pontibacter qinzhouensis]|uniref:DUF3822 family protein n=1 Tax=Pontibacter qinzhouensis TaxID=2603253 RepID=A0A5C8KAE4_9BACT|nr:DUF3822 family protein [Pontibacter qinzhouensis]TXK47948.1 DUF3822 family protein [Pontibacter qinzhouensis]
MNTNSTYFRLSHKILDEAFALSQAPDSNLYLAISQKSVRLGVVDLKRNKFVVMEDYELITVFSAQQVAEQLLLIAKSSSILQHQGWRSIRVMVSNQNFTLVPETLYEPQHQSDYLRLHSDLDPEQDQVVAYRHADLEAVNIFSVPAVIQKAVTAIAQNRPVVYLHQTSALIRCLLHQTGRSRERRMYLFVEQQHVTVLVISQNGLEFCNIFQYQSPEDFIYFVIFVMQEQKLNPEAETVTVLGKITHDAALFSMLQKYVRHVKFGKKPADVAYSYKFDDLFEHRYFELYSIHLCD